LWARVDNLFDPIPLMLTLHESQFQRQPCFYLRAPNSEVFFVPFISLVAALHSQYSC
jgi:hypothetical protein